jgi:hypothetical protein
MAEPDTTERPSPSELTDGRIAELNDWRGATLARVRALIREADPDVVAIDLFEGDDLDADTFTTLVGAAVAHNVARKTGPLGTMTSRVAAGQHRRHARRGWERG